LRPGPRQDLRGSIRAEPERIGNASFGPRAARRNILAHMALRREHRAGIDGCPLPEGRAAGLAQAHRGR
jgi:hypothetical protein